ncbi:DAK2 domain-containing protein [Streptomyces sp. N2-109]|uniref:DAK2 domain-containing protein n=1 Tax=Streptomyces gossypii TaxID=2883101 RepID=A0ABT2K2H1_9ACTN|nr:DAK2 domain-containing protein [Streptomyces gossypii]MCT2594301.1 DAK2 domain-containing protein [Streptomyces gossypii]
MPGQFDSTAVRKWCALALAALERERAEIDAINVYPVADGDTGSNLCLTLEAADSAVRAAPHPSAADALGAMAHGALLGACGNSGTILAQLLRGFAEVYAQTPPGPPATPGVPGGEDETPPDGAALLRRALRRAADAAYGAVARPVEGTMLTVAEVAAEAADGADAAEVARAAHTGARRALAATTGQLGALARAGVVDAGGRGLVNVLGALAEALGAAPDAAAPPPPAAQPDDTAAPADGAAAPAAAATSRGPRTGPAFEVMYLLDAEDTVVPGLRTVLDQLGDSLVVGGGDGLWNVHVHVDDAGAAIEAGIERGRPHRVRVTALTGDGDHADSHSHSHSDGHSHGHHRDTHLRRDVAPRAVVAVVQGDGLAALCEDAGATVVRAADGPEAALTDAIRRAIKRAGPHEVVLLPNDPDLQNTAARAAQEARTAGIRTAVIPTRAAVQGIAALAVHDRSRRFDEDVVAMTSAAAATRYGEVALAERQSWTTAGVCQAGDVLGLVEGDVAVIGSDIDQVAADVLERMLAAGGEMVTLVLGADAPAGLADRLREHVRRGHLAVDTVVHEGRQRSGPLLIGVE